jgi:adenine-specific DNA glycosylase
LSAFDFFATIIWKSDRSKTKVKKGLEKAGKTVEVLMHEVSQAEELQSRVDVLTQIDGIGIAIASAILTVGYPETFTVLDYRVWGILKKHKIVGLPKSYPHNSRTYVRYCEACQKLAAHSVVSGFTRAIQP